jgi:hypothetical protein
MGRNDYFQENKRMRKMKNMKKVIFIIMVFFSCASSAQEKTFRFEAGLNYPYVLREYGDENQKIGVYFNGRYKPHKSPLDYSFKISYENYTHVFMVERIWRFAVSARSLSFIPSVNYNVGSKRINLYAGLGAGLSVDNGLGGGVFNEGFKCHIAVVPQAGLRLYKHFNLSAQYYITHKEYHRLLVNFGYIF